MRKFHSEKNGLPYTEIPMRDRDHRPLRITAYLNLVGKLVDQQVKELQQAPFESNTDITRYFEMLPDSPLKDKYSEMIAASDPAVKARMQEDLRKEHMKRKRRR